MKETRRRILTLIVNCFGIFSATKYFFWRDRVAILIYHDPEPEVLDAHIEHLKKYVEFIPLARAIEPGCGRPRAAITFDDGHVNNAKLLPVFKKHGIRPTIYLCSSIVTRDRMHWWLHPVARRLGVRRLIRMNNKQRLHLLRQNGFEQDYLDSAGSISGLSAEQIAEMRPYVDFQSHTRFHPTLPECDEAECRDELGGSKSELEQLLGTRCEHFAYPYGMYGSREVAILRELGYKSARTTDAGWNGGGSDPYRLKGFDIDDQSSTAWLRVQLTGLPYIVRYLRLGKLRRALTAKQRAIAPGQA
jgi:peptidoglycan/xylan/chitin deacetylase (PgdA/CDA1 family)